jgi:hypothetical protein
MDLKERARVLGLQEGSSADAIEQRRQELIEALGWDKFRTTIDLHTAPREWGGGPITLGESPKYDAVVNRLMDFAELAKGLDPDEIAALSGKYPIAYERYLHEVKAGKYDEKFWE